MPLGPKAGFKDETAFNKWLRSQIRGRGYQCLHIREADVPGPLDLVVWRGRTLLGWYELKLNDREVEPSQIEFMRELDREIVHYGVIRFWTDTERFEVSRLANRFARSLVTLFSTDNSKALLDYILQ